MCEKSPVCEAQGPTHQRNSALKPGVGSAYYSPFQVTVHDSKEHLKEEVDGVYQNRQQVQPCFAGHLEIRV